MSQTQCELYSLFTTLLAGSTRVSPAIGPLGLGPEMRSINIAKNRGRKLNICIGNAELIFKQGLDCLLPICAALKPFYARYSMGDTAGYIGQRTLFPSVPTLY